MIGFNGEFDTRKPILTHFQIQHNQFAMRLSVLSIFLFLNAGIIFAQQPPLPDFPPQAGTQVERLPLGFTVYGQYLIDSLSSKFQVTNSLGYNIGRDSLYAVVDNVNGTVYGIYSGFAHPVDPNSADIRGDAYDNGNGVNAEHVFPQSKFDFESVMKSDLHHLYASKVSVNGARSNYPFNTIADANVDKWFLGADEFTSEPSSDKDLYSKLDSDIPEFEPRDEVKGDIARAMFYFWTNYQDESVLSDDSAFFENMKDTLFAWHNRDLPTSAEETRSTTIESMQGNKNPFVHDTSLARRSYFSTDKIEGTMSGGAGWRAVSIPVSTTSVSELMDDTAVQGISGGPNDTADPNIFLLTNGSYQEPASTSAEIDAGNGMLIYFFNNSENESSPLPITLDAEGTESSADVTVSLNSGNANLFTLSGNPFASNVNMNEVTSTGGNIQNMIWYWDNYSDSFVSKDRTADGGFILSPMQGFWVETSDASVTDITFPVSAKTTSDTTNTYFSKESAQEQPVMMPLTLRSDEKQDLSAGIYFATAATPFFDAFDATKMTPLSTSYIALGFEHEKDPTKLKAIESLPLELSESVTRHLHIKSQNVLEVAELSWKPEIINSNHFSMILTDLETSEVVDMGEDSVYSFEILNSEVTKKSRAGTGEKKLTLNSDQQPRFTLEIAPLETTTVSDDDKNLTTQPELITVAQNYPNPFNPGTTISFALRESSHIQLNVYNMLGQKVGELINGRHSVGSHEVYFDAKSLTSGVYYYELKADGQRLVRKMTLLK
jgi:hypothetical protein